ncbi:MAG TPA: hypothetical protein VMG40_04195 [Bryobacteraceae bacterium]|nr:hypothetical protein [Bryobacteraceae bacterium]
MNIAVVLWLAIASTVVGLAVYRKLVSRFEDDSLHMSEADRSRVTLQAFVAHRLDVVDKWGKTLTVFAMMYGAVLFAIYLYGVWMSTLQIQ